MMIRSNHSSLWSGFICPAISLVNGSLFSSSSSDYGFFSSKVGEHFQYSDKVSGIGYCHQIYRAFTTNELILERAEAYAMLGKYEDAANSLRWYWNCQLNSMGSSDFKLYVGNYIKIMKNTEFTGRGYYAVPADPEDEVKTNCFRDWNFTQNMSSSFVVPAEAVPYMNCVNDFRRYETVFDGLRFFDLKRWGMEYSHTVGVTKNVKESKYDDAIRAIEVPWEALSAGMETSRPQVEVDKKAAKATMNPSSFIVKTK